VSFPLHRVLPPSRALDSHISWYIWRGSGQGGSLHFWDGRDRNESASSIPGPESHDACIRVQFATGGVTALIITRGHGRCVRSTPRCDAQPPFRCYPLLSGMIWIRCLTTLYRRSYRLCGRGCAGSDQALRLPNSLALPGQSWKNQVYECDDCARMYKIILTIPSSPTMTTLTI